MNIPPGRDFASLKKFADENMGPSCGPDDMDLCDEKTKTKIKKYMAMEAKVLDKKIKKIVKTYEADCAEDEESCDTSEIKDYKEEVPVMKKVVAHLKKKKGGKRTSKAEL